MWLNEHSDTEKNRIFAIARWTLIWCIWRAITGCSNLEFGAWVTHLRISLSIILVQSIDIRHSGFFWPNLQQFYPCRSFWVSHEKRWHRPWDTPSLDLNLKWHPGWYLMREIVPKSTTAILAQKIQEKNSHWFCAWNGIPPGNSKNFNFETADTSWRARSIQNILKPWKNVTGTTCIWTGFAFVLKQETRRNRSTLWKQQSQTFSKLTHCSGFPLVCCPLLWGTGTCIYFMNNLKASTLSIVRVEFYAHKMNSNEFSPDEAVTTRTFRGVQCGRGLHWALMQCIFSGNNDHHITTHRTHNFLLLNARARIRR